MNDVPAAIYTYVQSKTGITTLTGTRIWFEVDTPRTGYVPSQGPALVFRIRGGTSDYSASIVNASVQFRCYGRDEEQANQLYRACFDAFQIVSAGLHIVSHSVETLGTTLEDPATGWVFVLFFVSFWIYP